ncbi:MAG: hypothetical protein ABI134_29865 [Byssovorax sp.]
MTARLHSALLTIGLVVAAGSITAGCAKPSPRVARGQAVATGQATYDDFFQAVLTLRAEGQKAREDAAEARAALIAMLGLEAKASVTLAVSEAELRAKKLREAGVVFHVDLVPDARVVAAKAKGVVNLEADDLAKAAEASTKSAITLSQRLGAVSARAAELEKIRTDLRAQAPATFRSEPQARRDEITLELDASAAVLTEASDSGERWGGVAAKFALDLARALETSGGADASPGKPGKGVAPKPPTPPPPVVAATRPPPPSPAKAPEPAPAKKPPAAAPAPAPAPAKPPAKKPKGGDDFEP